MTADTRNRIGQDGREPQRVEAMWHVKVERAQGRLVQRRECHRGDRHGHDDLVDPVGPLLSVQLFEDLGADLDREDHGV